MFLNYFALCSDSVFLVIFYGIIVIHDIPYLIAKKTQPPPFRCYSCRRMGQSFYSPCHLAVFMDMGHAVPT